LLDPIFMSQPAAEWIARFAKAGVPCTPINGYSEAHSDPQVTHLGLVESLSLPSGTKTRTVGSPMRFNGESFPIRRNPPALGEHTTEVLAELGLEESKPALKAAGAKR
jgi:crotonobetainyl-CoA:carnitine CoA-transferase CaiB-like acyl-CoA transferase